MKITILNSIKSELLKIQHSAALWLVGIGAIFIPVIMLLMQFAFPEKTAEKNLSDNFWEGYFNESWQSMALFLFPMGIILVTSLLTQLEFKNNAWKQLYTTPQPMSFIFISKQKVIFILMFGFLLLFNLAIYVSVLIPALIHPKISMPPEQLPILFFIKSSLIFFVDSLPIIALQFLISMRFKNFLASVGVGFALIIASMFAISWKYGYTIPYTYISLNYFNNIGIPRTSVSNIHLLSVAYFLLITFVSYFMYINRTEKG